jgi:hypothetical protein
MVNSKFRFVEKVRAKLHGLKEAWKKIKQRRLAKKAEEPVASNELVTSKKVNKRNVVIGFGVLAAIFVALVTVKNNVPAERMPVLPSKIIAFFETAKQAVLKQPKAKELAPKHEILSGKPVSTKEELLGRLLIVIALGMDPYGGMLGVSLGIIGITIKRFFKL